MKNKKIFVLLTLIALLLVPLLIYEFMKINLVNYKVDTNYLDKLFNKKTVVDIKIIIDEENSQKLYSDVSKEKYVHADITIAGEVYEDVGIRTKGNYIYTISNPVNNPNYKWAYKVKFNKFNKDQTFHGLTEIALNTNFSDPTFMKEVLNYGFFEDVGLKTPYYTFGNVTLNETDFGLVTIAEFYNIPYTARYYNETDINIYKPNNEEDEAGDYTPKNINAELKFIDYNLKNYTGIFEKTVTDDTTNDEDMKRLIQILEELSENNVKNFDIDSYIKYLAVANTISLVDTYSYSDKNFYLFESDKYLRFMPYDLNLAYANFKYPEGTSVTFRIDLDNFKVNKESCNRPLTCLVANNEVYYNKYKKQVNKFLKRNVDNNRIYDLIDTYDKLIRDYIPNEKYDFNYEEYERSLEYLKMYFKERNKYIKSVFNNTTYTPNNNFIEEYLVKFKEELYK